MRVHELIERIEGEAVLDFSFDEHSGTITDTQIRFPHFRGMEQILENRPALDALVITPRVCGICGHSHLMATVEMLESLYRNQGIEVRLTPKAQSIRQITRISELLQNHLKWLYLVMLSESAKAAGKEATPVLKGLYAATRINQLCALFSGQWPHSSYAIPGGVTCDPTHIEVMQALGILNELEHFLESEVFGVSLSFFEEEQSVEELLSLRGDFGTLLRTFEELGILDQGISHGRFLVLGEDSDAKASRIKGSQRYDAEVLAVTEEENLFVEGEMSYAKNAFYEGEFYETGPLARALAAGRVLPEGLYRRQKDTALVRLVARMDETVRLVRFMRSLLTSLDLSQSSCIPLPPIESISSSGIGIVEAPRGTLIHQATVEKGEIVSYSIITPTQWNLGNGSFQMPGVAQKAMRGLPDISRASLIFRTFDVCSVCTTH